MLIAKLVTADGFEGLISIPYPPPRYYYTTLSYPIIFTELALKNNEMPRFPTRRYELNYKHNDTWIYKETPV